MPNVFSTAKLSIGGPFGLCFVAVVVLTVTGSLGEAGLGVLLAWYVSVAGVGYAGRLPIHVFGCGYLCLRPRENPETQGDRRKLNALVGLNLASIVAWVLLVIYLKRHAADPSLLARTLVTSGFFVAVFWLAMETVRMANKLGLDRGTEWVCHSPLGKAFLRRDLLTPRRSPPGWIFARIKDITPADEVSAFLILVSCSLLAFPASGVAGTETGRFLRKEFGIEESTHHAGSGHGGKALLYDQECKGLPWAGAPAPEPQRQQLHALWLGGFNLGIDGAGAIQAGCAHGASPVAGQPGVYYAPGFCGETLRSLGVTSTEYLPALLYEPAAGFVRQLAREGVLIGASRRHPIRGGDFYLADTDYGSWVLMRSRSSTGENEKAEGSLGCERVAADNVPYQQIPPGLLGLWTEIAASEWVWPERLTTGQGGTGEFTFHSEDPTADPVATATCSTVTYCTAWVEGEPRSTTGSPYTTVQAISDMAR